MQAKIEEKCKQLEMYNENKITTFASQYYFYQRDNKIYNETLKERKRKREKVRVRVWIG